MTTRIDISASRAARNYTSRETLTRISWGLASPLFRFSPRPFWGWRRMLLRAFGAQIGRQVHVYPSVRITMPWNIRIADGAAIGDRAVLYALGPVTIGTRATVSQNAHLCAGTHDQSRADRALIKAPIVIGDDAWICADAFVGPGVKIGDRAILGARAVAMRDLNSGATGVGNPMREVNRK